jgi:[protein-PII] uridylyltransferase
LNDEKVSVQCARTIGSIERLKMLYLITWADSKATGPRAWNEWIDNLVQELFFKVLHILERNELATPHASESATHTRSQVQSLLAHRVAPHDLEGLFEVMSPRYLLNTAPRDIVRHIAMVRRLQDDAGNHDAAAFCLAAEADTAGGCWELTFLATDRPGLFSDLAGVLALRDINILSADIYTWRDGTVVDILKVSSPLDPLHPDETWARVKRDLRDVFNGILPLRHRVGQKAEPSILTSPNKPSRPPRVHVDNESSDFFTVIEVFADDRVGLLYLITRTLSDLRLDIRIAKIATKGDQIADVFYVRDLEGQRVWEEKKVREIQQALIHAMKDGPSNLDHSPFTANAGEVDDAPGQAAFVKSRSQGHRA